MHPPPVLLGPVGAMLATPSEVTPPGEDDEESETTLEMMQEATQEPTPQQETTIAKARPLHSVIHESAGASLDATAASSSEGKGDKGQHTRGISGSSGKGKGKGKGMAKATRYERFNWIRPRSHGPYGWS